MMPLKYDVVGRGVRGTVGEWHPCVGGRNHTYQGENLLESWEGFPRKGISEDF